MTNALAKLSQAERMLSEARDLSEILNIKDMAQAAAEYARAAKLGKEAQNHAAEIHIRAQRKAGEVLAGLDQGVPGRPKNSSTRATISPYKQALTESNTTYREASRYQQIASIPEPDFEAFIAETKDGGEELSTRKAIKIARVLNRPDPEPPPPLPAGEYNLILADPPWRYEHSKTVSREIENQYPTMSLDDICNLKVPAADDCVLFMWATSPKLAEAMEVIGSWGFVYRTCMVWIKDKIGMGYYARQRHELLLIAAKGSPGVPLPENRPDSVMEYPRAEHSKKPEPVYDTLEKMYPDHNKIELFARNDRAGWDSWGNDERL